MRSMRDARNASSNPPSIVPAKLTLPLSSVVPPLRTTRLSVTALRIKVACGPATKPDTLLHPLLEECCLDTSKAFELEENPVEARIRKSIAHRDFGAVV